LELGEKRGKDLLGNGREAGFRVATVGLEEMTFQEDVTVGTKPGIGMLLERAR
jgi:hypothetical protein